jgi:hypothetical protein
MSTMDYETEPRPYEGEFTFHTYTPSALDSLAQMRIVAGMIATEADLPEPIAARTVKLELAALLPMAVIVSTLGKNLISPVDAFAYIAR